MVAVRPGQYAALRAVQRRLLSVLTDHFGGSLCSCCTACGFPSSVLYCHSNELRGGRSNVEFDYRILARRKGYENIRLQDRTEEHALARKQIAKLSARNAVSESKGDVMGQLMRPVAARGAAADLH